MPLHRCEIAHLAHDALLAEQFGDPLQAVDMFGNHLPDHDDRDSEQQAGDTPSQPQNSRPMKTAAAFIIAMRPVIEVDAQVPTTVAIAE